VAAVNGSPCPAGSEGSQLVHLRGAVLLGAVVLDSKDVGGLTPNDGVVTYVLHVYATLFAGSN